MPLRFAPVDLGLSALLAGAVLAGILLRGRRQRRILALLGPRRGDLVHGAEVVVSGTLRVAGSLITYLPRGSEFPVRPVLGARTLPFEEAHLEVPSGQEGRMTRLQLTPEAQIVLGTAEGKPERMLAQGTSGVALRGRGTVHVLYDGDAVIGAGRLARIEAPDAPSYRDAADAFRLNGSQDSPPVLIAERARQGRAVWLLLLVALAPLVAGSGLRKRSGVVSASERPPCARAVDEALGQNDLLAADAAAKGCQDPLARARAAFAGGDFEAAHAAFQAARQAGGAPLPTVPEIESASLAQDFDDAAKLTALLADGWYRGPVTSERRRLGCVADAFASRREGKRTGSLEKEAMPYGKTELWCNLLAGDLESDHDARMWALQSPDDAAQTRRLLFLEAGEGGGWFVGRSTVGDLPLSYVQDYPLGAFYDPAQWLSKRHVALEDSVARALPAALPVAHEANAQAALFRVMMGAPEQARAFLEKLATPGGDRSAYIVGAIAALYGGDRRAAVRLLDEGAEDSNAVAVLRRIALPAIGGDVGELDLSGTVDPWRHEVSQALDAGNATRLAVAFTRDHGAHLFDALIARAKFTSPELCLLRDWVRTAYPVPPWDRGVLAVGLALGGRLLVAEALGDEELAATLRPRVRAFAAALTSRDPSRRLVDGTLPNDLLEQALGPDRGR